MKQCRCGALATERCIDCRDVLCTQHGWISGDSMLPNMVTDLVGILVHWDRPVKTADGGVRCGTCEARHAHRSYSEAAAFGAAQLPVLPRDSFLQACVIAAGGFSLRDPRVERRPKEFARTVHRILSSNRVPFNAAHGQRRKGLIVTRIRTRPSWELRLRAGQSAASLHVQGDGTWDIEHEAGSENGEVTDLAYADMAQLCGYVEAVRVA